MRLLHLPLVLAAAGMGCTGTSPAWAAPAEPAQADVSPAVQAAPPVVALAKVEAAPPAVALQGKPLDNSALGDLRGSGGIVVGNQTLNAITSGNSTIGNYTAGAVNISQSALSNFNGLGNITINTGAMSQLQSAMNVTVNVTP